MRPPKHEPESSDKTESKPKGGRAAERLREFLEQRFPGGVPQLEDVPEDVFNTETGKEERKIGGSRSRKKRQEK